VTEVLTNDHPQSQQFESFSLQCLQAGIRIRFQARGASMSPAIRDGEMVYVRPASDSLLREGDIVLVKSDSGFRMHRLVRMDPRRDMFITRGDCGLQDDPPVRRGQILGVAVAKDVQIGTGRVTARFNGPRGKVLRALARGQAAFRKLARSSMGPVLLRRAFRDTLRSSGLLALLLSLRAVLFR
jgi:Peptidase S24-like